MKNLQQLSIEKVLNKRYSSPTKNMVNNKMRVMQYLNWNMAQHLNIERLSSKKCGVDVNKAKEFFTKEGMLAIANMLPEGLDECSVQTFYLYQKYLKGGFKNYVPSNPLLYVLKEIDVDMKAKYVNPGTKGYFELSHANIKGPSHWSSAPMDNFLFEVNEDALMMSIQFRQDISPTSFYIPLTVDDNLSDVLRRLSFNVIVRDGTGKAQGVKQSIREEDIESLKVLFNLIIYVSNPNEEFTSQFNQFSPNNKIAQQEKLDFTSKPYVKLGFDAEFLRLITTDSFDVRAHWRWQPCGVGRQQRRLTFVKAHQRNITKIQGDGNGVSI